MDNKQRQAMMQIIDSVYDPSRCVCSIPRTHTINSKQGEAEFYFLRIGANLLVARADPKKTAFC